MRKTLTLLVASTALTAVIGMPAWSAMHAPADGSPRPFAAICSRTRRSRCPSSSPVTTMTMMPQTDGSRRDHDDDDGDDDDDDDCEDDDDDDDCRSGASNPAPAGTVAPRRTGFSGTALRRRSR